jgi:proline iminopeptidase
MYPAIEPYAHGMLATGDGNSLYWECCGNPQGKPALVLHGGPGSGCSPTHRRYFDPAAYNIVLLDQRQCGRSTPSARDPATDLSANTTAHLLADIEALREHLGIQRWLVLGGSWGCTLALAYAQHAPHRVTEMVLHAIATTSPIETGWITEGVRRLLPEAWEAFRAGAPQGALPDACAGLLESPDPAIRDKAARDWCAWEMALLDTSPGHAPSALAGCGLPLRLRTPRHPLLASRGVAGGRGAAAGRRQAVRHSRCSDPRAAGHRQPAGDGVGTGEGLARQ